MFKISFDIQVGNFKLNFIDSVQIKKSVETLSDTAIITLPGTVANKALNIEGKIKEGDVVSISLGYDENLMREFMGYVESISTNGGSITLNCEDSMYLFRKALKNIELSNITVKSIVERVNKEISDQNGGVSIGLSCNYEFKYEKFVFKDAQGWDVLKKIQDDTNANIFFKDNIFHIHPQYLEIANDTPVIYDFYQNVEKSNLTYRRADQKKYEVTVKGKGVDGKTVSVIVGTPGGDKRTINIPSVSDKETLKKRGQEELKNIVYTGFEGNFTGWLMPFCQPTCKVALKDKEYPEKEGVYYVIAVETKIGNTGGIRIITIGKKIG